MADNLENFLKAFSDNFIISQVGNYVSTFDESSCTNFSDWANSLEKFCFIHSLSDKQIILLAFKTSGKFVAQYIKRYIDEHENQNLAWLDLKEQLGFRFGESVKDCHINLLKISNIKQLENETIGSFSERLHFEAKDAYLDLETPENRELIERQKALFFTNGLKDVKIRNKLIVEDFPNLESAVKAAINESNIQLRCNLRSNSGESLKSYNNSEVLTEQISFDTDLAFSEFENQLRHNHEILPSQIQCISNRLQINDCTCTNLTPTYRGNTVNNDKACNPVSVRRTAGTVRPRFF